MIRDLVYKNRSYRRFHQDRSVAKEVLVELVDLARMSPSGRNAQTLKYAVACSESLNARIFPNLAWAGYLKDWAGPAEGERPAAYVIMLEDTRYTAGMVHDQGIAAQSILLGAVEKGLGGCIIYSVKREALARELALPSHLKVALVVALGEPKEHVVVESLAEEGDIKYWRDSEGVHHLPKRSLDDILIDL